MAYWCKHTAKRASINTLRCLAGCSIGDYSALAYMSVYYPLLPVNVSVPIACTSGITTSLILETALLKYGK
eukprot:Pgem_evm1s11231